MAYELCGNGLVVSDENGNRLTANVTVAGNHDLNFTGATCDTPGDKGFLFFNAGVGPAKITITKTGYETLVLSKDLPLPNNLQVSLKKVNGPWNTLTSDQIRNFKGNFCGPTLSYLPAFNNPNPSVLFTPAFPVYPQDIKERILKDYTGTHFVTEIRAGFPYSNHYPYVNQADAVDNLMMIYNAGKIPVCALMDDSDTEVDPTLPYDLIRAAFVMWEMNQPTNNNTFKMASYIWQAKHLVRPDCELYVHFSPDHAAGIGDQPLYYDPITFEPFESYRSGLTTVTEEGPWWVWAKAVGIRGIIFQNDVDADIQTAFDRDSDFTIRFGSGYHGWPTGLDFVRFEEKAYRVYNGSMTTREQDIFSNTLSNMNYPGMQPNGYCNGGSY